MTARLFRLDERQTACPPRAWRGAMTGAASGFLLMGVAGRRWRAAPHSNDFWNWIPTSLTTPVDARSVTLRFSAYSSLTALLATDSPCS